MLHPDVLIVGGGVIGLTTAWFLSNEGVRVAVAEQGEVGRQASWAGAGIIPFADLDRAETPIDRLRAHSALLHPALSNELRERTGIENGYVECGGVELPDLADPAPLPTDEWHSEGTPFDPVGRIALDSLWPGLHPFFGRGVHLPNIAQVRNPWHLRALRAACESNRVAFLTHWPVARLVTEGERILAVEGERGRIEAGHVLIAAGAWSEALLTQVGCQVGIRPVRGQIALLETGWEGVRPLLLVGKRYLVPRTDGRLLVGSTEEYVGFDARPTVGGVSGLLQFAVGIVPGLCEMRVEQTWAGLRPGSADGLPTLGRVPGFVNLHLAGGHFRSGLHLSPATGVVMAQHILGKPTLVPLAPFAPNRAETASV